MAYPNLSTLFGGYLGQDWPQEYPDIEAAIHDYMSQPDEDAQAAAGELAALTRFTTDDEILRRIVFEELQCHYDPERRGVALRAWLQDLVSTLQGRRQ